MPSIARSTQLVLAASPALAAICEATGLEPAAINMAVIIVLAVLVRAGILADKEPVGRCSGRIRRTAPPDGHPENRRTRAGIAAE